MTPLDLEPASQSSSWLISTYTPFYRQDCHWVSIIARGQRLTLASYLRSRGTSDDQSYIYIGIPTGNGTARHSISSSSSICTGYRHICYNSLPAVGALFYFIHILQGSALPIFILIFLYLHPSHSSSADYVLTIPVTKPTAYTWPQDINFLSCNKTSSIHHRLPTIKSSTRGLKTYTILYMFHEYWSQ